jgi:anti-sigma regulatory factor (Ser/Thr protein kinase)
MLEQCLELPARPSSSARARRFVADVLRQQGIGGVTGDCMLLTSELVTNALLYARSAVDLKVVFGPGLVRVAVGDESPLPPVPRSAGAEAESGRGLALVDAISSAWGVEAAGRGKQVWFEVSL